jgi:LAS superfamily LD-carboxypeptidase LdcB
MPTSNLHFNSIIFQQDQSLISLLQFSALNTATNIINTSNTPPPPNTTTTDNIDNTANTTDNNIPPIPSNLSSVALTRNGVTNGDLPQSMLKKVGIGNHKLVIEAADAFIRMAEAARKSGIKPALSDSYRPYNIQNAIFDWDLYVRTGGNRSDTAHNFTKKAKRKKKGTGGKVGAAFPGTSNHGWGRAVDVDGDAFKRFIRNHGVEYGWSWYEGRSVNENWHFTYDPSKKQVWPA